MQIRFGIPQSDSSNEFLQSMRIDRRFSALPVIACRTQSRPFPQQWASYQFLARKKALATFKRLSSRSDSIKKTPEPHAGSRISNGLLWGLPKKRVHFDYACASEGGV